MTKDNRCFFCEGWRTVGDDNHECVFCGGSGRDDPNYPKYYSHEAIETIKLRREVEELRRELRR